MQYQDLNTDKTASLKVLLFAALIVALVAAFSLSTHNDSSYLGTKQSTGAKSFGISSDKKSVQPSGDSSILGKPSSVRIQSASGTNQSAQGSQPDRGGISPDDDLIYLSNPEPCKRAYSQRPCIIPPP